MANKEENRQLALLDKVKLPILRQGVNVFISFTVNLISQKVESSGKKVFTYLNSA